jgi:hypothetical protein
MRLENHPDQPEWLSHVNASVLKVKLATAIIGISSIHLLKTFINAANYDEKTIIAHRLPGVSHGHRRLRSAHGAGAAARVQRQALSTPAPRHQPSQRRALRNIRIQGESSPSPGGCQDICTVRRTRSGCGMTIVKRPSDVVSPVMPPGEPLGLYG